MGPIMARLFKRLVRFCKKAPKMKTSAKKQKKILVATKKFLLFWGSDVEIWTFLQNLGDLAIVRGLD